MDATLHETASHSIFMVEPRGDTLVISPKGERAGFSNVDFAVELKRIQQLLASRRYKNVIVDLSLSNYFGSEMIGVINGLLEQAQRNGGRGGVCEISPDMMKGLRIMNLDSHWPIYPSRSQAASELVNESLGQRTSRIAFGRIAKIAIAIPAIIVIAWLGWSAASMIDLRPERALHSEMRSILREYRRVKNQPAGTVKDEAMKSLASRTKSVRRQLDAEEPKTPIQRKLSSAAGRMLGLLLYDQPTDTGIERSVQDELEAAKAMLDGNAPAEDAAKPSTTPTDAPADSQEESEPEPEAGSATESAEVSA
ncbi:STAS domain-containing protein [Stratiformator vulcanicus]|uniref:STAS domain-containing protein n=1 Tax=Stratiformator vulcanicus TaxID=2527980 RepID=A0A517QY71_9PLAN|nr:STAS domain-containing protein [Stratiformator vulcanicus]QDT36609.1 hypothetical protein Pan189_09690 [Stratiformator vulcanicus]